MIAEILNTALGLLLLTLVAVAYVVVIYRLARLVSIWEGRDVMERFRPDRRKVAATDRVLDDIHYEVVTR